MRIIAGRFKGLRLTAPKGRDTRPTADQVKEAIFSTLGSLDFEMEEARVLDFFSGSGALALEALSRGASSAVLADRDREALNAIRRNLAALPEENFDLTVIKAKWPTDLNLLSTGRPFDLLLLDPPYNQGQLPLKLLQEAVARGLVAPRAVAVWEQSPETLRTWGSAEIKPWIFLKAKTWGSRAAAFLQYDIEDSEVSDDI